MNSPDSLLELYRLANSPKHRSSKTHGVYTAELMREIGLKCIGLNGVSRNFDLSMRLYSLTSIHRSHEQSTVLALSTADYLKTSRKNSQKGQPDVLSDPTQLITH